MNGEDIVVEVTTTTTTRLPSIWKPLSAKGYALDGFPIYGETEADGSPVGELDEFNGQFDKDGNYHYHATKTYPYINGGMRGEVTVRSGQIDPQPRDSPVRPPGEPLRGATITNFVRKDGRYQLDYSVAGKKASISYAVKNGNVEFDYKDPNGKTRTESYRWSVDRAEILPDAADRPEDTNGETVGQTTSAIDNNDHQSSGSNMVASLAVTSYAVESTGEIQSDFTCDGSGDTPPLSWSPGPDGTVCYALNFWHVPGPGDVKSYWVLYDIPADVTSLQRNVNGIGKSGLNDKDRSDYDPICSRGPGTNEYNITVYVLSQQPQWPDGGANRDDLLNTIADITVAEGTLTFQYTRSGNSTWLLVLASGAMITIIAYLSVLRRKYFS